MAALGRLAQLGVPITEDGPGVRSGGCRPDRRLLDVQLLPVEEPLRARRRRTRDVSRRHRRARANAPLGSRDKKTFELVGTNSRLDAVQAAMLRIFTSPAGTWRVAGCRPLRRARPRRGRRASRRRAGPRPPSPFVRRAGRKSGQLSRRRESRAPRTTRPRSISNPRSSTSASPAARCPRRARRGREPRAPDVGRHRARAAGARRGGCGRRRARVGP